MSWRKSPPRQLKDETRSRSEPRMRRALKLRRTIRSQDEEALKDSGHRQSDCGQIKDWRAPETEISRGTANKSPRHPTLLQPAWAKNRALREVAHQPD